MSDSLKVNKMLAQIPIERIKERLYMYQQLVVKTPEDLLVQDMLINELNRRDLQRI